MKKTVLLAMMAMLALVACNQGAETPAPEPIAPVIVVPVPAAEPEPAPAPTEPPAVNP